MYKYLNVHPKGLSVGDCVKRAITTATGWEYEEVSRELNRYKKITGADKFNNNKNWKPYVEKVLHGYKLSFPATAGEHRMNGERFSESHPRGIYILRMAGHLSVCVDGVIYDTWDCSDKCVYNAWKIDRNNLSKVDCITSKKPVKQAQAKTYKYNVFINRTIKYSSGSKAEAYKWLADKVIELTNKIESVSVVRVTHLDGKLANSEIMTQLK